MPALVDIGTLARGSHDIAGFYDVQTYPTDAIERDEYWVPCCRVDLSHPGGEQFHRKDEAQSSVCAGYKAN
jgi:hypothetical protein